MDMTPIHHLAGPIPPRPPRKGCPPARLVPASGLFGWRKQDHHDAPKDAPVPGRDNPAGGRG